MSKKAQTFTEELTPKEWLFIQICRRIKTGTIDRLGVVRGEPTTYVVITERIDADNPSDLERLLDGEALRLSGGVPEAKELVETE